MVLLFDQVQWGPYLTSLLSEIASGNSLKGYIPRRTLAEKKAIKKEVKKMQWNDLIETRDSHYSAP